MCVCLFGEQGGQRTNKQAQAANKVCDVPERVSVGFLS